MQQTQQTQQTKATPRPPIMEMHGGDLRRTRIPKPIPGRPGRWGPNADNPRDPDLARLTNELRDLEGEHRYLLDALRVQHVAREPVVPSLSVDAWTELDGYEPTTDELAHVTRQLEEGLEDGPSVAQRARMCAESRLVIGSDSAPYESLAPGRGPCLSEAGARAAARVIGAVLDEIAASIPRGAKGADAASRMRAWPLAPQHARTRSDTDTAAAPRGRRRRPPRRDGQNMRTQPKIVCVRGGMRSRTCATETSESESSEECGCARRTLKRTFSRTRSLSLISPQGEIREIQGKTRADREALQYQRHRADRVT